MKRSSAELRGKIVDDFAKWTALSALRSGSPLKSRTEVYRLIRDHGNLDNLFDAARGPITSEEFDQWHDKTVLTFCDVEPLLKKESQVGWAAKIVNVYLKTRAYVGRDGRPGLDAAIHPPIDNGLILGLRKAFSHRAWNLSRIKAIQSYREHYFPFIEECRSLAQDEGCLPIELEYYWQPVSKGEVGDS